MAGSFRWNNSLKLKKYRSKRRLGDKGEEENKGP